MHLRTPCGELSANEQPDGLKEEMNSVCDTCSICRAWARPGHRNMATARFATQFNEFVESDLLFWNKVIVVNLVGCCIRWTETTIVPSKDTSDVLGAIKRSWVGRWGAPKCFISDMEGALSSTEGRLWMNRVGSDFKPKPTGNIGAAIAERHNDLLRTMLHKVEDQCKEERVQGIAGGHSVRSHLCETRDAMHSWPHTF